MRSILRLIFLYKIVFLCCCGFASVAIDSPLNSYTIIKKMGEGYSSDVFAVEDKAGHLYALKRYRSKKQTGMEYELSVGWMLDHPHIVKTIEGFIDAKQIQYLVLEFIDGVMLHQERVPVQELLFCLEALHYAFNRGFIHLDLQEKNIMVTREGKMVIIDLASFYTLDHLLSDPPIHIHGLKKEIKQGCQGFPSVAIRYFLRKITEVCFNTVDRSKLSDDVKKRTKIALQNILLESPVEEAAVDEFFFKIEQILSTCIS